MYGSKVTLKSDVYNRLYSLKSQISSTDSLIRDYSFLSDSTAFMRRRDSLEAIGDTSLRPMRLSWKTIPSVDSLNSRVASAMNELATLYLVGFSKPESTIVYYDALLRRFPDSRFTSRAWFTSAQALTSLDSTGSRRSTDSLYGLIIQRYPLSEFAVEARHILNLPPVATERDLPTDAYQRAESNFRPGRYELAADSLRALARQYPKSILAPKAIYAAGWIYEEKLLMPDSALSAYNQLTSSFPMSSFAALVRPKLAAASELKKKATPVDGSKPASADSLAKPKLPSQVDEERLQRLPTFGRSRGETQQTAPGKRLVSPDSTLQNPKERE
jgi:outer membrane protein assembly factor BamD (BamD/ComL family)